LEKIKKKSFQNKSYFCLNKKSWPDFFSEMPPYYLPIREN
jgi:hypothetical protein